VLDRPTLEVYISDIHPAWESRVSESKNERFRRLASSRGARLLREIALLGNLANTKNYDYTPEEVEQLFAPIEEELRLTRQLFDPDAPPRRRVTFT
jgi:hypothetical protein